MEAPAPVPSAPMGADLRTTSRLAVMTIVGLGLAVSAPGCSSKSDGGSSAPRTKTSLAPPATLDATSTTDASGATSTTAAPTTASPPPPAGAATPELAAQRLYDTWKAGDRDGASGVAEPTAVDGIWSAAPGDYRIYSGCDTGEFNDSGCLFRGDAGTIQVTMERRGDAWVVIEAFFAET